MRLKGTTYAVSNTGPLISAFQSSSFDLLTEVFAEIHTTAACVAELIKHGWEEEIQAVPPHQLVVVKLTSKEEEHARLFAKRIAQHPDTNDHIVENHLGEAEALTVSLRPQYRSGVVLLDELAARAIARQAGVKLSGFPGVLLLAVQVGLISPEKLKSRLELCRKLGTHYSLSLIQQVYKMAKQSRSLA